MLTQFNTESREKAELRASGGKIKMNTCGLTICKFARIGNFRTCFFEGLLRHTIQGEFR